MSNLQSLGFDDYFAEQMAAFSDRGWVPARIAAEGQSSFHLIGSRAPIGDLPGRLLHALGKLDRPVVGDWVAVTDGDERATIQSVLERRTVLLRRAAGTLDEPQILAVNVDVFFVVTAVNRDFSERRLERYITAVWNSGAEPVVVLNKIDLEAERGALREAIGRVAIGLPMVEVSAREGTGLDDLRAHIGPGKTIGFIGSSGVGKSSLINRLIGREVQAVGELRADERGRHTTTARQLVELPGGGVLVDTPGMRELGLLDDVGGVEVSFADVIELAEQCRFRDCAHSGEPGCAVEGAVASGDLPAERLESYRKLVREIEAAERKRDPVIASRTKARWKAIHRALRAREKVDPKLKR